MSVWKRKFGWKGSCCTGNRRTPAHTPPTPQLATCANTSEHAPREPSWPGRRADKNRVRALRSVAKARLRRASATWSPPKHCQINPRAEEVSDDPVFGRLHASLSPPPGGNVHAKNINRVLELA